MKTKLLFLTMLISIGFANAQITLENEYTNNNPPTYQIFYPIQLSGDGFKYVEIDTNRIVIYNLNHSVYKTIPLLSGYNGYAHVLYVSDALFDTDSSTIEYLVYRTGSTYNVSILNENGNILFSKDSAYCFLPFSTATNPLPPIWETFCFSDSGTKMILGNKWTGDIYVYNLPGTLPKDCQNITTNDGINHKSFSSTLSQPFPNPSQNSTQVNYKLPDGEKNGEIIFYNLSGIEVKRFKVDNTFYNLVLNNSDLPSGTYLYHLVTPKQTTSAKKMLVIK